MKLKIIKEAMNGNGPKTPEQVMTAAVAVMDVRGGYVKSSEQQSTKSDVLQALWGIGVQPGDPSVAFFHSKMKDPAIQNRALQILNWVRNYQFNPQDRGADFMRNAQMIANKTDITDKMVGFVVGVIPGYERTSGRPAAGKSASAPTTPGLMITRAWPAAWGEVKMIWKQPVVVAGTRQVHTKATPQNGGGSSFQCVDLVMDNQYEFSWFLSDNATVPTKGKKLTVSGYLERDKRFGNIRFVADKKWAKKTKAELNIGEGGSSSDDDSDVKD